MIMGGLYMSSSQNGKMMKTIWRYTISWDKLNIFLNLTQAMLEIIYGEGSWAGNIIMQIIQQSIFLNTLW